MTDDDPFLRSLRQAADPGLSPGAGERIAAGAWARAGSLRASAARFHVLRRTGWAAAAAVLVAVAALALRGTDPAFAVEGDPVMVEEDGAWVATRRVPAEVFVMVPEGSRVLRSRGGGSLSPRPGSRFRCVAESPARAVYRVEFTQGGADVEGTGFVVAMRDAVVVERDPSAAAFRCSFALGDARGAPHVEVGSGRAIVRSLATSERLLLRADERATLLSVSLHGERTLVLTRLAPWSRSAAAQVEDGRIAVVDADFGPVGGITLVGRSPSEGFLALEVPPAQLAGALSFVNRFERWRVRGAAVAAAASPARYVYEKGAARVELIVDARGAVSTRTSADFRRFPDLAAFRRDAPDLAALFGDALGR